MDVTLKYIMKLKEFKSFPDHDAIRSWIINNNYIQIRINQIW